MVFYILFLIAHCVWTPCSLNMVQLRRGLQLSMCCCPTVFHPVECSYCRNESMMGFRYRCQQCHGYQLCQSCFWRGHASGPHSNQHQMKEHSSWVCSPKNGNSASNLLTLISLQTCIHLFLPRNTKGDVM